MFSLEELVSRTSSRLTSLEVEEALPTGAITEVSTHSRGVVEPSEAELVSSERRRTRPDCDFVFNGFLFVNFISRC